MDRAVPQPERGDGIACRVDDRGLRRVIEPRRCHVDRLLEEWTRSADPVCRISRSPRELLGAQGLRGLPRHRPRSSRQACGGTNPSAQISRSSDATRRTAAATCSAVVGADHAATRREIDRFDDARQARDADRRIEVRDAGVDIECGEPRLTASLRSVRRWRSSRLSRVAATACHADFVVACPDVRRRSPR